jgi:hypothetical protein
MRVANNAPSGTGFRAAVQRFLLTGENFVNQLNTNNASNHSLPAGADKPGNPDKGQPFRT